MRALLAVALSCSVAVPAVAEAQRVRLNMQGVPELTAAGFQHLPSGTSTFDKGVLRVQARGFEEWSLRAPGLQQSPWRLANGPSGWIVEARVYLDRASAAPTCGDGGPI
jgi:hypothetical protein